MMQTASGMAMAWHGMARRGIDCQCSSPKVGVFKKERCAALRLLACSLTICI